MVAESIFTRFLKRDYPDYNPERHYYKEGDIIHLPNGAEVLVMMGAITFAEILVTKSGFGMKKGHVLKLHMDELPIVMKADYVSPPPRLKSSRHLQWEVGDILVDKYGHTIALYEQTKTLEFSDGVHNSFYAMIVKPREGAEQFYGTGVRVAVHEPHTEYHGVTN